MPIGDLLAQISGGDGPASAPAPGLSRSNTLPKRKADEDLRLNTFKAPRTTTLSSTVAPRSEAGRPHRSVETSALPSRFNQPSRPLDRSSTSQRPTNGTNPRPSVLSARPLNGSNRVQKSLPPSRPSPGPSNAPLPSRAAPKKGSFAEILARGQRAQAVMGQVGKIQHKKVEKGAAAPTPKKEKDEPRMDPRAANSKKLPQRPSGYSGTAKPGQRNGPVANGGHRDGRNGKAALTKADIAKSATEEEREKKFKKAAAATTGYTGTARPKPGASSKKHDTPRGGALLSRAPRPATSKSRFDDGYDEDMDDFIDYDDEGEDEGGPRYDYDSDASSDMEAGLDDIDGEERRAEHIARREDIEEERLERSLKAAKEDRKRKALEALRGGRRR
ncbi:hypothetical protein B0J13DRAFT_519314 [Dactylonectria estremocensis]|uniref:SPT2 chromatin protein n=1 Tax=Dactylonectria estremocensis TaxID=1079267 RepID=A0A9P9FF87_9HYPO|nr:hypothetical protein B0J13DRAFT_519314 [Dactylonectria estremocensis]